MMHNKSPRGHPYHSAGDIGSLHVPSALPTDSHLPFTSSDSAVKMQNKSLRRESFKPPFIFFGFGCDDAKQELEEAVEYESSILAKHEAALGGGGEDAFGLGGGGDGSLAIFLIQFLLWDSFLPLWEVMAERQLLSHLHLISKWQQC
ncbi:hypothetical protein FNV43_RR04015 [Rhamnella rubrinervis]|uniref:Uncharacterized protein n=1 Tax=Rhamnella rubrinervis TaxID=2594499 RepID=A0A8K0MQ68_9ROSA|nr:hypothetical protein FNV43_RR04015 [Rhamnella rubrinervis]